jgi:hypothetical protein
MQPEAVAPLEGERTRPLIARARFTDAGGFVCASAVFALVFWRRIAINSESDLHAHIDYARNIASVQDIVSPHFLFQVILKTVVAAVPISYEGGTAVILGVCYGAMGLLIVRELRKLGVPSGESWGWSLAVLLASHVFLPTLAVPNLYYGYLVPTAYHNPTQQLNKLFALAIWVLWSRQFVEAGGRRPQVVATLAALCIGSALAKPSFLIGFLPISGLLALRDLWRRHFAAVVAYALAIAVPTLLVLVVQAVATYGAKTTSGVIFAPFAVFTRPGEFILKLPMALAFPVVVTVAYGLSFRLQMAWLYAALAIAYAVLLAESGPRLAQGNFAWTTQTGIFLLYVEAALVIASHRDASIRWKLCAGAFAVHVVSGLIYAVANAMFPAPAFL